MRRLAILLIGAAAAPATARAQGVLALAGGGDWLKSRSVDPLLEGDFVPAGHVELGAELLRVGGVALGIDAAYENVQRDGTLHEDLETRLRLQGALGGVRAAWPVWRDVVRVLARAGGGAYWATASIEDGTTSLKDRDLAPGAYALAGVEVWLPDRVIGHRGPLGPWSFGVRAEGGWRQVLDHHLDGTRAADRDEQDDVIAGQAIDLGDLSLSAPMLRVGVVMKF